MTRRTPFEILPIPSAMGIHVRRQHFQLVIGNVAVWSPHCYTPNPRRKGVCTKDELTLHPVPSGRKYGGTPAEIKAMRAFREVTQKLYEYHLGHLAHYMKADGLTSKEAFLRLFYKQSEIDEDSGGKDYFSDHYAYRQYLPQIRKMILSWVEALPNTNQAVNS